MPEDVDASDTIPSFVRTTGFASWNRYAAVNYEFVPIHMDDEAGQAAGFTSAFGMGGLQIAYVHNMLRDWIGDDGRIVELTFEIRGPNLKGQTVAARGTVTSREQQGSETMVALDIWTETEEGEQLGRGTAVVAIPEPS
jgi:acyl dehydratase